MHRGDEKVIMSTGGVGKLRGGAGWWTCKETETETERNVVS